MSPKVRFGLSLAVFAALFYALRLLLFLTWPVPLGLGYVPAVLAVMAAAQGIGWKRKIAFVVGTAALSILLGAIAAFSGIGIAAGVLTGTGAEGATNAQLAAFVVTEVFSLVVPLAALALFVGRRPSRLWAKA